LSALRFSQTATDVALLQEIIQTLQQKSAAADEKPPAAE
jgi:hypothetical protein